MVFTHQRYYAVIRLPPSRLSSLFLQLVRHTQSSVSGVSRFFLRTRWASPVALLTVCNARMGLRLRVSNRRLPRARRPVLPSGMHKPWAGSDSYKISELNTIHSRVATPGPFILAFFLCTLQPATSAWPYTLAATLDTGPLAGSYPGGIRTRLSTNHFQYARATDCYAVASSK